MTSKEVKTELREYLDEKKLNSLFVTIVEAILTKVRMILIRFFSMCYFASLSSTFPSLSETTMPYRFHGEFLTRQVSQRDKQY